MLLTDSIARERFLETYRRAAGWLVTANRADDSDLLEKVLGSVHDELFPGAVLPLPSGDRQVIYYAVCESSRSWRELAPLLKAFIGVTVTDFEGRPAQMRPEDPVE